MCTFACFLIFLTVYNQDVTCADGFYRLNNTCRPHCTDFEQIDHMDAQVEIGFWYFVAISNIIITILFIIVACFKRKTVWVLAWYMVAYYNYVPNYRVVENSPCIKNIQQLYTVNNWFLSVPKIYIEIFFILTRVFNCSAKILSTLSCEEKIE